MCFRLLAAVRKPPQLSASGSEPVSQDVQALNQLAFTHGLDVRTATHAATGFVEVAWGECACSLYTRRDGRERVVGFVDALVADGWQLQLLLFSDGDELDWTTAEPAEVSLETFRIEGLASLPERWVARVVGSAPCAG
jgi:hypothetical protein